MPVYKLNVSAPPLLGRLLIFPVEEGADTLYIPVKTGKRFLFFTIVVALQLKNYLPEFAHQAFSVLSFISHQMKNSFLPYISIVEALCYSTFSC